MLTTRLRPQFPRRRSSVRSALPPSCVKRDPLAKSAPRCRAATNRGISAPSADPSASTMTMMSPRQAAKPQARALPLPLPVWRTILTSGYRLRATATVSSVEWPSTRITSSMSLGRLAKTYGRFLASLSAGMTTLMRGAVGSALALPHAAYLSLRARPCRLGHDPRSAPAASPSLLIIGLSSCDRCLHRRVRVVETQTQTLRQSGEMVGFPGVLRARKKMLLYLG